MRSEFGFARHLRDVSMIILILAAGCGRAGDEPKRSIVRGKVRLNHQLVEDGQIRFIPLPGTPGPVAIAPVHHGEYVCDDKGGVPVGKHRVEILAWDPQAPVGGRGQPPRAQRAPAQFNINSELMFTVEDNGHSQEKNWELSAL